MKTTPSLNIFGIFLLFTRSVKEFTKIVKRRKILSL